MDEAKNQINDMEHKEAKNNQSKQEKRNKQQQKMRIVLAAFGTTSSIATFTSQGCQKEKRKKLEINLKK